LSSSPFLPDSFTIANTGAVKRMIRNLHIVYMNHGNKYYTRLWRGVYLFLFMSYNNMGEKRNAYRILMGNPEGKRPLGRPRCRWVDNIKTDLREIGWDGGGWIDLAQDREQ
jgi:hypothetical protein